MPGFSVYKLDSSPQPPAGTTRIIPWKFNIAPKNGPSQKEGSLPTRKFFRGELLNLWLNVYKFLLNKQTLHLWLESCTS